MIFSVLPISLFSDNDIDTSSAEFSTLVTSPSDRNPDTVPCGMVRYVNNNTVIHQELRYVGETFDVRFDIVPQSNSIFLGWSESSDAEAATYYTGINSGTGLDEKGGIRTITMEKAGDIILYPVWMDPEAQYSSGDVDTSTYNSVLIRNGVTSVNVTGNGTDDVFYLLLQGASLTGAPAISIDTAKEVRIQFTGSNTITAGGTDLNNPVVRTSGNGKVVFEGRVNSSLNITRALDNGDKMTGAVIGGSYNVLGQSPDSGHIQIESGTMRITVTSPQNANSLGAEIYGAGIGGGQIGTGTVAINGGDVSVSLRSNLNDPSKALAGISSAAIGGGARGMGTVAITGGTVNVRADVPFSAAIHGAGIGGGGGSESGSNGQEPGSAGIVTITGGNVDVRMDGGNRSQFKGAAIGGGGGNHPGNGEGTGGAGIIKITGGTITTYRSNPRGGL